jgi:hypothetical protein
MSDLPQKLASTRKWLRREFIAATPVFFFFLAGFLIILVIVKLALEKFSIEVTALSSAVVGALVAAKAVLILDETSLARHLESYCRFVAVAIKTCLYGVITILLGCLERLLEARHRVHSFDAAAHYLGAQASLSRLLAWSLAITLLFGVYFVLFEISLSMGKGELWNLFFEAPKAVGRPRQSPKGIAKAWNRGDRSMT